MQTTAFEFEKARDFGSIISDALQFFARNFKSFLLGFLIYAGPFFLIGALAMTYAGMHLRELLTTQTVNPAIPIGVIVFLPCILAASIMLYAFVCAVVQKYQKTPEPPLITGLWPYVRKNIGSVIVAGMTILLILVLPCAALVTLGYMIGGIAWMAVLIFLAFPFIIYLAIPLNIFLFVHVLEQNTVDVSLRRAFFLVRGKWWVTFLVYLLLGLIAGIASYIFTVPAYIVFAIQSVGALQSGDISAQSSVTIGLLYALGMLGALFANMYQILGVALQYYTLREQKEGVGLQRRIDALDQPEDSNFV